jgi:hypothetical protein
VALLLVLFAIPSAAIALAISSSITPQTTVSVGDPFADLVPSTSNHATPSSGDQALEEVFGNKSGSSDGEEHEDREVVTCSTPPANGKLLSDLRQPVDRGHALQIQNGTQGDAIVKLRDALTARTVASFFVASGQTASLTQIPDGKYRVQYAFGNKLGADCKSFIQLSSAGEFPDTETLETQYEEEPGGTRIITGRLSYTLYSIPGGNVHPMQITGSDFDRP